MSNQEKKKEKKKKNRSGNVSSYHVTNLNLPAPLEKLTRDLVITNRQTDRQEDRKSHGKSLSRRDEASHEDASRPNDRKEDEKKRKHHLFANSTDGSRHVSGTCSRLFTGFSPGAPFSLSREYVNIKYTYVVCVRVYGRASVYVCASVCARDRLVTLGCVYANRLL